MILNERTNESLIVRLVALPIFLILLYGVLFFVFKDTPRHSGVEAINGYIIAAALLGIVALAGVASFLSALVLLTRRHISSYGDVTLYINVSTGATFLGCSLMIVVNAVYGINNIFSALALVIFIGLPISAFLAYIPMAFIRMKHGFDGKYIGEKPEYEFRAALANAALVGEAALAFAVLGIF